MSVLLARGVTDITVCEPSEVRRKRALRHRGGAHHPPEELSEAPIGAAGGRPFDVAFECSGHADAGSIGPRSARLRRHARLRGHRARTRSRVNHNRMIVLELEVLGAYNYDAEGFGPALELLASGALPVDLLIEPEMSPWTA